MSRRLAVTKDGLYWAVCGPWTTPGEVPRPWAPSAAGECRHRDGPHLHVLLSTWEHAHAVALRLSQPTQPTPYTLEPRT